MANAHSRSSDAVILSSYMGESSAFADAIANFLIAYVDQTEQDYNAMVQAEHEGRIQALREE